MALLSFIPLSTLLMRGQVLMALLSFIPLSTLLMRGLGVRNSRPGLVLRVRASPKICS